MVTIKVLNSYDWISDYLYKVATSWKSPGYFLLSWIVLENIWKVSRASPGQNSKATFFNYKHKKVRYM